MYVVIPSVQEELVPLGEGPQNKLYIHNSQRTDGIRFVALFYRNTNDIVSIKVEPEEDWNGGGGNGNNNTS